MANRALSSLGAAELMSVKPATGFAPIAGRDARMLVLGSFPGPASLLKREYYAHPRNLFWPIMRDSFGWMPGLSYRERTEGLVAAGIALWDVCERACRPGALDAAIQIDSVVVNDFSGFLGAHKNIRQIAFNGAKAEHLYRRLVLPQLPDRLGAIPRVVLPSTSPAYAAMRYSEKLSRWQPLKIECGSRWRGAA